MNWERKLAWIGIYLVAAVIAIFSTGYLVFRSEAFHSYVIKEVQKQASQAIGARVEVKKFNLHPFALSADAYGITVHGGEEANARPLVRADRLLIRLKIATLLHRKVDLSEVDLLHPVVNLVVNKNGSNNLPVLPQSKGTSSNPLDLGIRHILLDDGEIYCNDVKTPLSADLHDLRFEVRSEPGPTNYNGTLSYHNGRVQYRNAKPLPHDLAAAFEANSSKFVLKTMVLRVAATTVQVQAQLQNYSDPSVHAAYQIIFHPKEMRPVLDSAGAEQTGYIPAGEIALAGSLSYQHQENVPTVRSLTVVGRMNGTQLTIDNSQVRAELRKLKANFHLQNGNLDVTGLEVDLLGGHLSATATIRHLDTTNSKGMVRASLASISLDQISAAAKATNLARFPIHGILNGTTDALWTAGIKSIKAHSDILIEGGLPAGSKPVPLGGEVHVGYDGQSGIVALTNTHLATPQTRIILSGTAGQNVDLKLQGHAADLREIDSIAAAFAAGRKQVQSRKSVDFAGTADLQLSVKGHVDDPHIVGQLNGHSWQIENTKWRSLAVGLKASKSYVSVENGSLVNAQQGYINFAATSALSEWHFLPSSPVTLELNSQGLEIEPLLKLARLNYPVYGGLSVAISMRGSQLNPQGNGSIGLIHAKAYGEPLQEADVHFSGDGNTLTSSLNVTSPAGWAKANLAYHPKNKEYELQLDAPTVQLAELQAIQEKNAGIGGILSISANGKGTIDDPQLTSTIQIPQLQIRHTQVSDIKASLNIASHKANLTLNSDLAQTLLQANGTLDLTGQHYLRASFDTKAIPIEGLLALYSPLKTDGPHGVVEIHASAEGPLDDKNRMKAQLVIPTLKANYQGLQIGNTEPVQLHYAHSIITVEPTEFTGTDTDLRLQGQIPVKIDAATTLVANGSIDLRLLQFFQHDLQSSGKLRVDLHASGPTNRHALQGQIRLQNVAVVYPDAPVSLQNANGVLDVSDDRIDITEFTGEAGGGQISAHGVIDYRPQLQSNVVLQAKNVRIRYQDQIRSVLEGHLNLVGSTQAATLSGRVLIDSLSFTPNFDLATLAGQVQSGPESTPSTGVANNLKLAITVQTSRDMSLTSSAVSLEGQANLRITGTAADPVIVGRTEFTAGDIFLMNQRYRIERGIIEFSNPNRTEPVLNMLLTSTINQYNLSLNFRGPLDKLQTNYVSDPPLPTADIINLIARGQTTEQAAASPSNLGATSLLAQGAASEVSGQLQKLAGLSSLSIDPTLGGNNSDPSARIAMQKRVTNNLLVTFATDVTSAQREIIQGEYKINKGWSASVTRDENGGFAVDGKYHKRY
jgi:translocation and assembly module TamB